MYVINPFKHFQTHLGPVKLSRLAAQSRNLPTFSAHSPQQLQTLQFTAQNPTVMVVILVGRLVVMLEVMLSVMLEGMLTVMSAN